MRRRELNEVLEGLEQHALALETSDEPVAKREDGSYEIVEPFFAEWIERTLESAA